MTLRSPPFLCCYGNTTPFSQWPVGALQFTHVWTHNNQTKRYINIQHLLPEMISHFWVDVFFFLNTAVFVLVISVSVRSVRTTAGTNYHQDYFRSERLNWVRAPGEWQIRARMCPDRDRCRLSLNLFCDLTFLRTIKVFQSIFFFENYTRLLWNTSWTTILVIEDRNDQCK